MCRDSAAGPPTVVVRAAALRNGTRLFEFSRGRSFVRGREVCRRVIDSAARSEIAFGKGGMVVIQCDVCVVGGGE